MTYRVQVDLSFIDPKDADAFQEYVAGLKPLLYVPNEDEVVDRPDLWVGSRMNLIKDYDDEGKNRCGESFSSVVLTPSKSKRAELAKFAPKESIELSEPLEK